MPEMRFHAGLGISRLSFSQDMGNGDIFKLVFARDHGIDKIFGRAAAGMDVNGIARFDYLDRFLGGRFFAMIQVNPSHLPPPFKIFLSGVGASPRRLATTLRSGSPLKV